MADDFAAKFDQGLALILEAVAERTAAGPAPAGRSPMSSELAELAALRGRPAFLPYLGSGIGRGARAMLADGHWLLDLTLGIGVHLFGHGNLDLIATAVRAAASDLVMQGNLIFNREYIALMRTLMAHAPASMANCWLSLSGADANENALKLVRQRRGGRPGIVAFRQCFHGRTSAMAEITDRPDYRQGQPSSFPVHYIPFYDRTDPASSEKSLEALRAIIRDHGAGIAAFIVELVQGEAGFVTAPREFFVKLFEECRRGGLAIWIDEVQTFARTLALFATDWLGLAEYADVITIGKVFQGSALLMRAGFTPDPALISGTYAGATVAMAVAARMIEKLTAEGIFGAEGRAQRLESLTREHLARLARKHPEKISNVDGVGLMIAFRLADGSLPATREFIQRCFANGLALYYGGHDPVCIRLFLPVVITDEELADAFAIIDRSL
jgi:4-aminobutyrate aminotransferase-like enzyme